MPTSSPRSMSPDEFDKLKRLVQIFIVTAVPVEHKAVQEKLTPIDKDIITIYGNYEFGFFGKFLVAHQCVEAGSLKAATAITSMLTEFGISSSSKKNFYVLMPGIACGLQRSKDDQTTIPISELAKYLDPKNPLPDHLLLPDDLKKLLEEVLKPYNDKFKEDPNITIPLFLTPERQNQKPPSNQFVGDILLATSIEQHSYEATKANKIENRTHKYMPSKERLKLIQAKIPHWQTTPDATIDTRLYQVHPGLIISGDHLVNNFSKRQSFISHNNDAIGLEMEGAALGASIDHFSNLETSPKAFFIFAKSICDWGVGKSDLWQKKAASTSVSFLHFCLDDPFFFGNSVKPIDPIKISNIFSTGKNPKKLKKTSENPPPTLNSNNDSSYSPLLSQIPSPPKDFVGRNLEINEITSKVHLDGTSIIIIRGMGGVGKSTLAYALAEQLKEVYKEGQLHVKLMVGNTKPLLPSEAMSQVIRSFERDNGQQIVLPDNQDELGNIYRGLLNNKKIVLLLDNAMNNAQIEPLIPPKSCVLLITSRNYLTIPGAYKKRIKTLPRGDSVKLIISIEKRIDNKADSLAELCGDLPIALRIAADLLAKREDLSVDEYITRLTKAKERLKLIDATISLSYDFLSPHEQELWRSLSVFQNSFISVSVAAIWDMRDDFEKAEDILWEFVSYSLLEFDEATKRYNFHDLVRLFADSKLIDTERFEYQKRYSSHFRSLSVNIKELYLEGNESIITALDIFDLYWKDIEAALKWADTYYRNDQYIADLYSALIGNLVQVFSLRLPLSKQIELHNSAINAAIVANNKESEAAHRGNLAQAYVLLGDFQKAKNCVEESLALFKEINGTQGEEGKALNYAILGRIHYESNDITLSINYHTTALNTYREIGNRRGEASELCSLAMIYSSGKILSIFSDPITQLIKLYENVAKAESFYNEYLNICKELGDLRGEAIGNLNIGIFYEQVSLLEVANPEKARATKQKAIESYKKSYDIAIKIDDKENVAKCLFNTGSLFMELNQKEKAINFLLLALQVYKEIADEDHIAKTTTLLLNCGYKFH